ncbi:hypothetical protein HHK36_011479 [Tetracentron sinense]|uniref:BHLH domain-containing protein n=1 Tax=Tetracentron sinense TaxID=13715 RepID=A0A834ZB68_TETSI|nr:hypothetical protein HHK36_011479 [Tetracentron sinense]
MGFLLKEALKCLCGENRWSYAIFWKIACRNPTLLVWEECHYEPASPSALPSISGIGNTELLKEWEGLWNSPATNFSHLGCQVENSICSLLKKMMNNQVHVVGEGIVGRAAFTGNHQWILQENCMGEGHPSEVLAEAHHQFSAGMQTIAVIPVLPHGAVQLGSSLAIMENMGFVNDVKSLFVQLGSVPGALLSESYTKGEPSQKIGVPASLQIPFSADLARNSSSNVMNFTPSNGDFSHQQIPTSQASGLVSQPSLPLITLIQDNMQTNGLTLQTTPSLIPNMTKSHNGLFQPKALSVMTANVPLRGQLETGPMRAQVILSNPDARLNQWASPYNSSSGFSHQSTVGQSGTTYSRVPFMEPQILSDVGLREPFSNSLCASSSISTSLLRNERAIPHSVKDSVIVSLLGGSELPNAGSDHQKQTSILCSRSIPCRSADTNSPYPPLERNALQLSNSSKTGEVFLANHLNHSNSSDMVPGGYHQSHPSTNDKHTQTELAAGKQRIENDLFQALNISSVYPPEHISRHEPVPGFLQNCWVSGQKHNKEGPRTKNVIFEDVHVQPPSRDDLFDILGLDFKSEQLHGSWNDIYIHQPDANTQNLGADVSTCITQQEAVPDFSAVTDGISESGIFSVSGPDNLLDAVVSKVHSAAKPAKQNSDDNVSCRTTLTKLSGTAVPTDSTTYGQVILSDQMQVESHGHPPALAKAGIVGPSSSKSGCSKDNAGECSQINSMYGSQSSLWVEEGQNMKHDNSISTAYSQRPDEIGKSNRKRLRPGESPRPRPKDRQMIQDRVKELREIVPNGAKCSIDALLERTIKHMQFLDSVTKHADKLKQTGESKISSRKGGLLLNENFEGGATWAFEVGSQSMVCPIIVEDLHPPRQMLVEMLCEERGFFLEIADIIRGLGLTILKGVMEARNDKVWARFVVEANRDVTRMEIFLLLVHVLEQTVKSSAASTKGIDNSNMMVHQSFDQASIPASGRSNNFQ